MEKTPNQKLIADDIMRYKKNKWGQMLALLGLVFNCLYFMLLYAYQDSYFTRIDIGLSIILTLVLLLAIFLSSESVKNYKKAYSYVLIVIAAFQIFRIFGYPLYGLQHNLLTAGYFGYYPTTSEVEFTILLIYLVGSAACLVGSAVISFIQCTRLELHMKKLAEENIDIVQVVKEMDEEDAARVQAAEEEDEVAEAPRSEAEEAKEEEVQ